MAHNSAIKSCHVRVGYFALKRQYTQAYTLDGITVFLVPDTYLAMPHH